MALSLSGERSITAATPVNPFAATARWIGKAMAARARRSEMQSLLEFDTARLRDLGISRGDIHAAIQAPALAGRTLHAARARNARG